MVMEKAAEEIKQLAMEKKAQEEKAAEEIKTT